MTELLYTKQTHLERMAAEKAAQQLAHERQLAQAKDDAERVKRWALATHHDAMRSANNKQADVLTLDIKTHTTSWHFPFECCP